MQVWLDRGAETSRGSSSSANFRAAFPAVTDGTVLSVTGQVMLLVAPVETEFSSHVVLAEDIGQSLG